MPQWLKENRTRPIIPGILALATVLALMVIFMITLKPAPNAEPAEPETTAAPTVAPNPYSPTDFTYDDRGYLTAVVGSSVLGIDVSEHQLAIDWEQVKAAGVEFVMIRIGWRGQTTGKLNEDTMAQENYAGAKAAGLKVGAYFFSQAITPEEAAEEAEYAMGLIRGWELDMPLVFDWEQVNAGDRTAEMDSRLLTQCTKVFCDTVAAAGYKPMIYFNSFQAEHLLELVELTEYSFWLAMYSDTMNYPYQVDMWQYSCTGQVPGIETPVDLNLLFPEFRKN